MQEQMEEMHRNTPLAPKQQPIHNQKEGDYIDYEEVK